MGYERSTQLLTSNPTCGSINNAAGLVAIRKRWLSGCWFIARHDWCLSRELR